MKGILILQLLTVLTNDVTGDFEVVVAFESYSNPTGRCLECPGATPTLPACCDSIPTIPQNQTCPGTTACETVVRFCERPVGSRGLCQRSQEIGLDVPQGLMSERSFNITSSFFGLFNPVALTSRGGWEGFQLLLIFRECSRNLDSEVVCDDLIDSIPIDLDIEVGTSISKSVYSGTANISQVVVSSIEVRCVEGFYGPDCFFQCSDFVSCAGCGLSGFTGQFCQFSIDGCSDVYCNGNGNCREGSVLCDCDIGFTGDRCETNIDDCAEVECSNGVCVDQINSFKCECKPGFAGNLCQDSSMATFPVALAAGSAAGGLILIVIVSAILIAIMMLKIRRNKDQSVVMTRNEVSVGEQKIEAEDDLAVSPNTAYDYGAGRDTHNVELTQNQAYGSNKEVVAALKTQAEDDLAVSPNAAYDFGAGRYTHNVELTQNQAYGSNKKVVAALKTDSCREQDLYDYIA